MADVNEIVMENRDVANDEQQNSNNTDDLLPALLTDTEHIAQGWIPRDEFDMVFDDLMCQILGKVRPSYEMVTLAPFDETDSKG